MSTSNNELESWVNDVAKLTQADKIFWCNGGEVRRKPHLVTEHSARLIPPSITGYLYQLMAGMGLTSAHWLHKLLQPTLILAGDDDPIVPPVNSRLMSLLIPNNRLHIVHGGGHLFLVHSTGKVIPLIHKFLDAPDDEL